MGNNLSPKRRIIIFDKRIGKIIYDEPVKIVGCYATNFNDFIVEDCAESESDYERRSLKKSYGIKKQR